MAKNTITSAPVEAVAEPFKAFQWQYGKYEHHHSLQTAALDIGKGIATILEIIEAGLAAHEHYETPMFNDNDRASLLRMAITSASLLAEKASGEIEFENTRFQKAAE
ncbi:hypothetical protein [Glaciimonas immobilis]|uniref:Uncharacterized protein n=1 Tax=Glaciimonas immobilis TaxID=728004 RepID=A0A840RNR0_9BURK|nr:hypothetical protein [Glaciimonas immobilis]KAF3999175.1 hypothetical protein HAV38_04350 [Glaciimonas immobilis]MBB5198626.1 hypothetical protein [Glaciimonas immobilis]